jgi:hypothetical protein
MLQQHLANIIIFSLAMSLSSCGQEAKNDSAAETLPQGEMKGSAVFTMLVPDGWEFAEFPSGTIQAWTPSRSYAVEVKIEGSNMNEKDVEWALEQMRERYDGTPLVKEEHFGRTFLKTTYDFQSMHQSRYSGLKDGKKISITLSGPDHESDATVQAMFGSIVIQ